jgi:excinuclease ABC subunit B
MSIHQSSETGLSSSSMESCRIFPAKHHVTSEDRMEQARLAIEDELKERLQELKSQEKMVELQRLQQRVLNDLLMLKETGFCAGGENYSRHFASRAAGEPPDTLIDYMKLAGDTESDWLLIVDESHVTLPQLKAM